MHHQSLMLLHPMVKEKIHLQENTLFDLDLGVKVTQNVAQYPRHHVTYAPPKFDIATSHGCGGDAFARKYIKCHDLDIQVKVTRNVAQCPVPSTSCDLCTYRVWSYYGKIFRRRSIYKKIQYWPWPWGQGHTKCCPVPSTSCDLSSYKVWSCYV